MNIEQQFEQGNLSMKNRLVKSAMSEALCGRDALPNQKLINLYDAWAGSGIGMLITGNVMVDPKALGEPGNCVVESDTPLDLLSQWAKAGKSQGSLLVAQLNHPGKQAPIGLNKETVSPSSVPFAKAMQAMFATPRALEVAEIETIIQRFASAAKRMEEAGFDGVQIHGAHGYLVSQFLSPKHNVRTDHYGGSIENRMRFLIQICEQIRAKTAAGFVLGVKLNSADFQRGGFSEDDSLTVIKALEAHVDFVEVSGGTYEAPAMTGIKQSTREREAYFLEFAAKVRGVTNLPLVVTGGFRSRAAMDAALQSKDLDLVGLARPLAVDLEYANKLLNHQDPKTKITPIKTHIKPIDNLGVLEVTWYAAQFKRIAAGLEPDPKLSPFKVLGNYMWGSVKASLGLGKKQPKRLRAKEA